MTAERFVGYEIAELIADAGVVIPFIRTTTVSSVCHVNLIALLFVQRYNFSLHRRPFSRAH